MAGTIDPSFPADTLVNIPMDDVQVNQYYTLADMQMGDYSGTTDTDDDTDTGGEVGYTRINSK